MRGTDSGFEREDALACADVLGGFGVASGDVREHVDGDAADLETAIRRALADPEHPTAFLARTIAGSPRGVDAPARFWTTAPATQLGDAFAAIDWTFDVRGANGRSLSVDDVEPYRVRVEDADGRARSTTFSFPDTALGDDNYPAFVHAVNAELLYGLPFRFVQLSDGTDRWRFALVETAALDRLRERFGERVAPFDRPLLSTDQPAAYVPAAGDGTDGRGSGEGGVPVPSWARDDEDRSWRGRRLTADAFDADAVGGLDHLDDGDASAGTERGGERDAAEGAADAIEFVGGEPEDESTATSDSTATSESPTTGSGNAGGSGTTVVRDAEADDSSGTAGELSAVTVGSTGDDLEGWSVGGSVDATTRSAGDDPSDPAGDDGPDTADAGSAGGGSTAGELSASGFDWCDGVADGPDGEEGVPDDRGSATGADASGPETSADAGGSATDDGFFDADAASSFDAGATTSRVEGDSFGVDAAAGTDDEFAAVGAALAAPADISVSGLLDDDEFLPELPRAEPEQTRIEFDESFDPSATPSADERETTDGFVWVNEGAS